MAWPSSSFEEMLARETELCECAKIIWEKGYENYVGNLVFWFFFWFRFSDLEKVLACTWPNNFFCVATSMPWLPIYVRIITIICQVSPFSTASVRGGGWTSTWFLIFEWSCCEFWGVWNLFCPIAHQRHPYVHMDLPSESGKKKPSSVVIWWSSDSQV